MAVLREGFPIRVEHPVRRNEGDKLVYTYDSRLLSARFDDVHLKFK